MSDTSEFDSATASSEPANPHPKPLPMCPIFPLIRSTFVHYYLVTQRNATRNGDSEAVHGALALFDGIALPRKLKFPTLREYLSINEEVVRRAVLARVGLVDMRVASTRHGLEDLSSLHVAALGGGRLCELLLSEGACDVNVRTEYGETPLHAAALTGKLDSVNVLMSVGADLEATTTNGETPLFFAAVGGHALVVRSLLRGGAHADASRSDAWTALHVAAARGHDDVVRELLEHCKFSMWDQVQIGCEQWMPIELAVMHLPESVAHSRCVDALRKYAAGRFLIL